MTTRRYDPLADLLSLQERMNRLFEDSLLATGADPGPLGSNRYSPPADACETSEAFVIQVELPGVLADDVELQVEGDQVMIKGERRPTPEGRPERFYRMERLYGAFARIFRLPEEVDTENVKAHLQDGLLTIEVPKAHASRPRRRE